MDIKKGAKNYLVSEIQKKLLELDFTPGPIDGEFGDKTEKAVIRYQKKAKLKGDGVIGLVTAESLGIAHLFHVDDMERLEFKGLLISNPNYFGNCPDCGLSPVKKISQKTKYEEITCVGFNPDTDIVTATVQVKLPYGYGGDQCGNGSMENIRFYIDYGAGDGWEDLGLGGIKVWDLPNAKDCAKKPNKPVSYIVSLQIETKKKSCHTPVLPKVRAILSWNQVPAPNNPDWPPVWGNVVDKSIQVEPHKWPKLELAPASVFENISKYLEMVPIDIPGPPPVEFTEIANLYTSEEFIKKSGVAVEPNRFGHSNLQMIANMALPDPDMISNVHAKWSKAGLDIHQAYELLEKTKANVSYEELYCVGLDPNRDWLEATFLVKKPAGYSSGLCKPGSMEYVAFWADWDDSCEWSYLGTAEVNVHDILEIPPEGLNYTAFLPVDLDGLREGCSVPKIARIRAVLSWNYPPSTTDPNSLRHYGNRLDTHIQIKPAAPKALIERIGGVSISQIDYTNSGRTIVGAQMMPSGSLADYWGNGSNMCPFGGGMYIVGKLFNSGKYRLKVRPANNPPAEEIVRSKFWITKGSNPPVKITPDPATGFVNYADVFDNHDDMLGWWSSHGENGMWEIMLERVKPDLTVEYTPWYKIDLDNIEATADITLDGGACGTFVKGVDTEITGKFIATDANFAGFRLHTMPDSISPPAPQTPDIVSYSSGSWTKGTIEAPIPDGEAWKLVIDDMDPCGYVVEVRAYDLTIRNNRSNAHSYGRKDVGFCVLE